MMTWWRYISGVIMAAIASGGIAMWTAGLISFFDPSFMDTPMVRAAGFMAVIGGGVVAAAIYRP